MAAVSYFSNFPKINYFNTIVPNITLHNIFIQKLKQESSTYYPYTIEDGETADTISTWYYGRPDLDWVIYLANDIVDPHTQWPKSYLQMQDYITMKYGSISAAQSNVEYYQKYPETYYISVDGYEFSVTPDDSMNATEANADIKITPQTYALIDDQINYFPVYSYEYEMQLNDDRKTIILIDNSLKTQIVTQMRDLLNG